MDDLRRVRKRIRGRRFDGAGAQEQKQRPFILFRMIYHAVMLMMCICVVVLALLLNQKLNLVKNACRDTAVPSGGSGKLAAL